MGAYLNKPITEKHSETDGTSKIRFAATSMQGWRVNQEDAHNCILNLKEDWHLFAVYDGHGGSEVAKFTSQNFPEFLKKRDVWDAEDIVTLLENTFVDFDDHLRSDAVMKELKVLAGATENNGESDTDGDDPEGEAAAELVKEGTAPLEELLKRYGYAIVRKGNTKTVKHHSEVVAEHAAEAEAAKEEYAKKEDSEEGEGSSAGSDKTHKRPNESPHLQRAKRAKSEKSEADDETEAENGEDNKGEEKKKNGESGDHEAEVTELVKKPKPDAGESSKGPVALADIDVGSSDDESYKGDEEEEEDEAEDEDEEEVDGEGEGEEEEEEEDEDEEDPYGGLSGASFGPSGETPGEDSGTTACVCLVAPGKVIVANAGDSRAVLCRANKAIDLSVDHKPEDETERTRINRAGGIVNEDGRVNGGLNLSRAFGDHCYKKNKTLPLREQMISALPDVKIVETTDEDDFIVVACDGIWNSLESQEVVDFVRERLNKNMDLIQICEEMCTHCLADSTAGDGTGCDNMTIVIADLKPATRTTSAPAADDAEAAAE